MKISRLGLARCPDCLSHVKVADDDVCPFCGAEMADAETIGSQTMEKLRSSRAALVAMGLAGGVSFTVACGEPDPKPDNNDVPVNAQPEYGVFDPDASANNQNNTDPDMGTADTGEEDMSGPINVQPEYGVFDPDAG